MKSEVTQELYQKVMGENPSYFKGSQRPVEDLSWYDAVRFANKLSNLEGREECYQIGSGDSPSVAWSNKDCSGWRLPTEAEWEYAARGNEDYKYAGSNSAHDVAWYGFYDEGDKNRTVTSKGTKDVCTKPKNGFGLCDMSGNVFEWVWDKRGDYSSSSKIDPVGGVESPFRVLRGGSWYGNAMYARASYRHDHLPSARSDIIGFRVLRVNRR